MSNVTCLQPSDTGLYLDWVPSHLKLCLEDEAKIIAPRVAIERVQDKILKFDGDELRTGPDTEDARYGFEEDEQEPYYMSSLGLAIERCVLPASKTMVQADILFNLPPTEQYSKSKSLAHVPFVGNFGPFSWSHRNFASAKGEDKQAMQRHMKTAASWDFERMIPCHEDVIEVGDKNAWKAAYKAYLN
ncbi:uncharacterized protein C8R40DRAFT_1074950 [Lentinula edodes]|uniref:uncharacterized protein n=1 Tax=Lentinula edodes TaxID=5353 RepID=UPI001E8D45BD|nr:uncharacterized protein C8R40DRAFT_1074950 [Lentinula edodes]KAH7868254.1 hypothetical protein C8R40DRAFT_1074950 [Lentinula edodes]